MSFEKRIARLEEIVRLLESRDMTLDRGLKLFEEGISCLQEATRELDMAEASVKVLKERTDGILDATEPGA